ncbi:MAG TPA: iron ABC transporter permease [Pseudorhodoplanes sp.]|jgi:iron(III) transport system permease protein|nr:iron ABC transporter permease [Pseudorhodoplanes sp.]
MERPSMPQILFRPGRLAAILFAFAVAAFAVAPLASLIRIALAGDAELWPHLVAYVLPPSLADTLVLLAGVGAIACVAGAGTAFAVTAYRFPGRDALVWLLPLPLAIPTYIIAYVYADMLDALGPVQGALRALTGRHQPADYWFLNLRSLGGAIFVMGFVLYPYVYLAARAMFQTQSAMLIQAARIFGATPFKSARYVALPLARPAIAAGLALAMLETLNDIGASEYLGVRTLTLSIFTTWLNRGSLPGAAQIACLMLLIVAALVMLERYGRGARGFAAPDHSFPAEPLVLRGKPAWIAALVCSVPVLLGFVIPFAYLAREAIARGLLAGFEPALLRHTFNTVALAGSATIATLALGFGIVEAWRATKDRLIASAVVVASLGYAMPGTVLALGLLSPLVAIDDLLNALARGLFGTSVGLLVAGSGAALVIAYVARFLAIPIGFAQAGFARIPSDLDSVARVLGASPRTVARAIHLPLLRQAIWGAALLVFVDCLKELPATLLLRPLNVETLSTYIYQFATRGNFEEGSLAALIVVLVGILPVIRMVRHADTAIYPKDEPAPA